MSDRVQNQRVHELRSGDEASGPVVYWMSREQRAEDNWALLHAQDLAVERRRPLVVLFTLDPAYPEATRRHYDFMLRGLEETEIALRKANVPMHVAVGPPPSMVPKVVRQWKAALVVVDFDPIRVKREWQEKIASELGLPIIEVDSRNVVPCRHVSQKLEFGAYTIRPKIHKLLSTFLIAFPKLKKHPHAMAEPPAAVDWAALRGRVKAAGPSEPVSHIEPGAKAAAKRLRQFLRQGLERYATQSNDPNAACTSLLSAYLHFGQISAQRVARAVEDSHGSVESRHAFLEQLIVRREICDNFCLYQPAYDQVEGFPDWARQSIDRHRKDPRDHLYTHEELENSQTHDTLWNAAQRQMVDQGYMPNYLRMYWAKKILEWTESPEEALQVALTLNNRYELDGRDPNGFVGVAWSIGGVHDRAWPERPVFGKIRYMNAAGCKRKFDVDAYVAKWSEEAVSSG